MREFIKLVGCAAAAAAAALMLSGAAHAQAAALTIDDVSRAAETHNVAVLKRALADPALFAAVAKDDPQAGLDVKLAIADALAQSGDPKAALDAYKAALTDMVRLNGKNDPQQIDVLRKTAALRTQSGDLTGATADLDLALDIARATFGEDNATTLAVKGDGDRAWAALIAKDPTVKRPLQFATRDIGAEQYDLIEIYYATHRKPTGDKAPARYFGKERGPMAYGKAYISVPRNRKAGAIPVPSIWKLEFRADPEKHLILTDIKPEDTRELFFRDLTGRIAGTQRKEVFVFIHGFNSTFEAAAMRTAQLAADLSLDGAPILYSWASKSSPLGYKADSGEADVESQIQDLSNFLADVAQKTGASRVHLVAHSLGNKFLMEALTRLAQRPAASRPLFDEVVMAAADVSAADFQTRWNTLRPLGKRFTLYASKRDYALLMSQSYNRQARLGDAHNVVVLDGMQTIDTTAAAGGLLGHADFDGNALDDFRSLIWDSLAPAQRCVLQADVAGGKPYWVFAAGTRTACTDVEFREVVSRVRKAGSPVKALQELQAMLSNPAKIELPAGIGAEQIRQRLVLTYGLANATP